MANNVKLKDLYDKTQTYSGVDVVYLPDADNENKIKVYTERTVRRYSLHSAPTFEPTVPGVASQTFIFDAEPGALMEYPIGSGKQVGFWEDYNVIGAVANPNEEAGTTHSVIHIITENPSNTLLYTYEDISSENLNKLPLLITTTGTFTVTPGWSKAVVNANGEITSFEHLDDVSNIVFDVKFPTTTFVDDVVNAVMYEASQETKTVTVTQNGASSIVPTEGKSGIAQLNLNVNVPQSELQEKSVTITQNGTTEVVPDEGYDGMSKLTAVVNVEGGGGGVQANWAQNDSAASDYVQNRPGAYYETIPGKTYAFDGNLTGKTYDADNAVVFVSSDIITKDVLSSATYTRVVNGESTTAAVANVQDVGGAFIVGDMSTMAAYVVVITTDEASAMTGLAKGIWFGCNADATTYTSALTTPGSSIPVELPQELTEVKQSDWGAKSGISSIQNRIGGYYNLEVADTTIAFDGSLEGKEVQQFGSEELYIKVLDYPLTMMQLSMLTDITIYLNDADVSTGNSIVLPRWDDVDDAGGLGVMMVKVAHTQDSGQTLVGAIMSVFNSTFFKYGTYLQIPINSDGSVKQPYIKSATVRTPPTDLLWGWYIYPDFNGKPISGDALILPSSTPNSAKKFKITVDDTGTLKATEVTN